MSWLGDWWNGAPSQGPAPASGPYPAQDDLDAARQGDIAYGSGMEEYLDGSRVKDASGIRGDVDTAMKRVASAPAQATAPADRRGIADLFTKGYIAAHRDPISALGYDPSVMGIDRSGERLTLAGLYSRPDDAIWATAQDPSAIVHESIHRGLKQISESGLTTPEQEKFLTDSEEYLVRRLMQTQMGNPEAAEAAAAGRGDDKSPDRREQASARFLYEKSPMAAEAAQITKQLHDIAYVLYGQRRPALGHR